MSDQRQDSRPSGDIPRPTMATSSATSPMGTPSEQAMTPQPRTCHPSLDPRFATIGPENDKIGYARTALACLRPFFLNLHIEAERKLRYTLSVFDCFQKIHDSLGTLDSLPESQKSNQMGQLLDAVSSLDQVLQQKESALEIVPVNLQEYLRELQELLKDSWQSKMTKEKLVAVSRFPPNLLVNGTNLRNHPYARMTKAVNTVTNPVTTTASPFWQLCAPQEPVNSRRFPNFMLAEIMSGQTHNTAPSTNQAQVQVPVNLSLQGALGIPPPSSRTTVTAGLQNLNSATSQKNIPSSGTKDQQESLGIKEKSTPGHAMSTPLTQVNSKTVSGAKEAAPCDGIMSMENYATFNFPIAPSGTQMDFPYNQVKYDEDVSVEDARDEPSSSGSKLDKSRNLRR